MERREQTRTVIWFPVAVRAAANGTILGVSRDISVTGILVSAASSVDAGTPVTTTLAVPPDNPIERVVKGHVVRTSANDDDPDGLWPFRLAIVFDEPLAALDAMIDDVEASSRRW